MWINWRWRGNLITDENGFESALSEVKRLEDQYIDLMKYNSDLSRAEVTFKEGKHSAVHRWFKYREGYSERIVTYYIEKYNVKHGVCLDPFAGSGTTAFASARYGFKNTLIELLPVGLAVIKTKMMLHSLADGCIIKSLREKSKEMEWKKYDSMPIDEINITRGAYPKENEVALGRFLSFLDSLDQGIRDVYMIALLDVLERVSFTRKDGQYLRWDYRSGKSSGKFNKGDILEFDRAVQQKLMDIADDLEGRNNLFGNINSYTGIEDTELMSGSCLDILPNLEAESYSLIFTSPPYANRYDYTRTYALELAMLGLSDDEVKTYRQRMLSCTVENRSKNLIEMNASWDTPTRICNSNAILNKILQLLEFQSSKGKLNNKSIIRMLKNYFLEMSCVIYECHRVLQSNGYFIMVNDNVRYAGVDIPVDIILTQIAKEIGFFPESIDVIPNSKGNSSQQMAEHGKNPLRKCVYVWRKL